MNQLHIVSFDNPFPPNYGGAIDVFYKIKELSKLGIKITLHYFLYNNRKEQKVLNNYCDKIYYYKRFTGISGLSLKLPYIVYSRRNKLLLQRLSSDTTPILFEGLHTTYYLNHPKLKEQFKIVRCHNIEHEYYRGLSKHASGFKKIYYKYEAMQLAKHEDKLHHSNAILPLSQDDNHHYTKLFPEKNIVKTTAFHSSENVNSTTGKGNYLLFHGSLHVIENEKSAFFLLRELAPFVKNEIIITGSKPSDKLIKACKNLNNIILIPNPSEKKLNELVENAHINLIHSTQKSGLKLKLIKTLFSGKFILCNHNIATEDDLKDLLNIANSRDEWLHKINELMSLKFTEELQNERIKGLKPYLNFENAMKIKKLISH